MLLLFCKNKKVQLTTLRIDTNLELLNFISTARAIKRIKLEINNDCPRSTVSHCNRTGLVEKTIKEINKIFLSWLDLNNFNKT